MEKQAVSELSDGSDFSIAIYSGQFWPKAERPPAIKEWKLWSRWKVENSDMFTPEQFDLIAERLKAGKPWVVFDREIETLIALDGRQV